MKKYLSLLAVALIVGAFFVQPVRAETNLNSLDALIQSLMAQVQELQRQLTILQGQAGGSTDTTIGVDSSETSSFGLLTPNGGDQWQMQSRHAITWQPNPHGTSTIAYLEKKTSSGFQTVGKIIPVGKGSIIWDGEVGSSGSYPRPGNYYVRIENTRTGESDRSDRAFTLLKPGALVDVTIKEINGEEPNGVLLGERSAVVSASDKNVDVTWASKVGVEECEATVYNAYDTSKVTHVGEMSPSGTQTIALPGGNKGEYYVLSVGCRRDDGSGTGYDNTGADFVYLTIGSVGTTRQYIDVSNPVGGERYVPGQAIPLSFEVNSSDGTPDVAIRVLQHTEGKDLVVNEVYYLYEDGFIKNGKNTLDFYPAKGSSYPTEKLVGEFRLELSVGKISCCKWGVKPTDSDITGWFKISYDKATDTDPYELSTSKVLGASASYQDVLNQMGNTLRGMQGLLQGLK
jgi:hypothetical protein